MVPTTRRRPPSDQRSPRVEIRYEAFPVDVTDRGTAYVLAAVLPGVRREAVGVRVDPRTVTISVTATPASIPGETGATATRRSISLPTTVDPAGTTATFRDGILEITTPKRRRRRLW